MTTSDRTPQWTSRRLWTAAATPAPSAGKQPEQGKVGVASPTSIGLWLYAQQCRHFISYLQRQLGLLLEDQPLGRNRLAQMHLHHAAANHDPMHRQHVPRPDQPKRHNRHAALNPDNCRTLFERFQRPVRPSAFGKN